MTYLDQCLKFLLIVDGTNIFRDDNHMCSALETSEMLNLNECDVLL